MTLTFRPQFQPLHPQCVLRICLPPVRVPRNQLASIHGSKGGSVILVTMGDKCLGNEALVPSRRLPGSFVSLPTGRRILYCQLYTMIISRVPSIFVGKCLYIRTLRIKSGTPANARLFALPKIYMGVKLGRSA